MAEVLVKFTERVRDGSGRLYAARAFGAEAGDGLWEGWIEFANDGQRVRTGRETEQPNRGDLIYWAEGLTMVYLEGALDRAQRLYAMPSTRARADGSPRPLFDRAVSRPAPVLEGRAVLDPFKVYASGEGILRQQLGALSRDQLLNIFATYRLVDRAALETRRAAGRDTLADEIVGLVRTSFDQSAERQREMRKEERGKA